MAENLRANCPLTGLHCEGRQGLLDLQTQLSVEATLCQPNVITDNDGRGGRITKRLANIASGTTTALTARGLSEFSQVIDSALDAQPAIDCRGSLCGTLGNVVLAYSETFMPESATLTFGGNE